MFYYTCDQCHYTFASTEQVYICPKCNTQTIERHFGTKSMSVSALRKATKWEIDVLISGNGNVIPCETGDTLLILFRNFEKGGIVFAKIGKSPECKIEKGEHYHYKIGLTPYDPKNSFTFEPMNIVYKYIHYGDQLVVFSFDDMFAHHWRETEDLLAISENEGNKGCFQANVLYVSEIVPLNSRRAIDLIVSHISEHDVEDILVRFYDKGSEYYEIIGYLEQQLRKRFSSYVKQHVFSGDIERKSKFKSKKNRYNRKSIEIDYVTYRLLLKKINDEVKTGPSDLFEFEGESYYNAEVK